MEINEKTTVYANDSRNLYRYSLGYFTKNPILCIGINPSTATPQKWDSTINKVNKFANNNGFEGWIMVNLYPQRASKPNQLDLNPDENECQKNIDTIKEIINTYDISKIWAAWGNNISIRPYLKSCLKDIYAMTSNYHWINCGNLTKLGNPRHPLYLNYNTTFTDFDISSYINK